MNFILIFHKSKRRRTPVNFLLTNQKTLPDKAEFFDAVGSGIEPHAQKGTELVSTAAPSKEDCLPRTYRSPILSFDHKQNNLILANKAVPDTLQGYVVPTVDTYNHSSTLLNLVKRRLKYSNFRHSLRRPTSSATNIKRRWASLKTSNVWAVFIPLIFFLVVFFFPNLIPPPPLTHKSPLDKGDLGDFINKIIPLPPLSRGQNANPFINVANAATLSKPPYVYNLNKGLVGHWTFDGKDLIRNVADRSGLSNTGYMSGFTSTSSASVSGKIGQGLKFDGVNDYVDIKLLNNIISNLENNATVSMWFRTTKTTNEGPFGLYAAGYPSWFIKLNEAPDGTDNQQGKIRLFVDTTGQNIDRLEGGADFNTGITDGSWHHLVAIFKPLSNKLIMYIDGVSQSISYNVATFEGDENFGTGVKSYNIGSINNDGVLDSPFTGSLDDVRIYNRALSASEIKELYNMGGAGKVNVEPTVPNLQKGLVGHWTFDGKDMIRNVADRSGRGNTGYMSGFTSTSSAVVAGKIGQGLKFDGVDDYMKTGSSVNFGGTKVITTSFWMSWDKYANDDDMAIELSDNYNSYDGTFMIDPNNSSSGFFSFSIQDSVGSVKYRKETISRPSARTWHHYVAVFNNSTTAGDIIVYLDGILQNTTLDTNTKDQSSNFRTDKIYFMNRGGSSLFGGGKLDDVRIYNRALSAGEIKELYNMGGAGKVNVEPTVPNLQKGLVGHWTFDGKDLIRNAADRSGLGNTGYLSGFTSTSSASVSGKIGQGLRFDGVNDKVNLSSDVTGTSAVTICAWMFTSNPNSSKNIVVNNKIAFGTYASNNRLQFYSDNGTTQMFSTTNSIPAKKWVHACATRLSTGAAGTSKIYINGDFNISGSTGTPASGSATIIGNIFPGILDDVRIYNRALSASEIKELYLMGK